MPLKNYKSLKSIQFLIFSQVFDSYFHEFKMHFSASNLSDTTVSISLISHFLLSFILQMQLLKRTLTFP